jgi:hypothetical protein
MADAFDPYREAMVMETDTQWPEDVSYVAPADRVVLAARLHASAAEAACLEYVRTHTGFCRRIVVTPGDLERITK